MGLVTEEVKKNRDYPLLSVEYFYETKQTRENVNNLYDQFFITDFLKSLGEINNSNDSQGKGLQSILLKYNESIDKKIIISSEALLTIINACLKSVFI
jgi:hypothetical protein